MEYRAPTKRPLAGGKAFQAAELCLEQGYVRYGAYAIGNKKVGMFLQGPRAGPEDALPFLYPPV